MSVEACARKRTEDLAQLVAALHHMMCVLVSRDKCLR